MSNRIIGLTGGIATGKTTATDYLRAQYELPIIDADQISKELTSHPENLQAIRQIFAPVPVLNAYGYLDRSLVSELIFRFPRLKLQLEKLLHPQIIAEVVAQLEILQNNQTSIIVLVAPLLFETKLDQLCTETWLITTTPQTQIDRLLKRNPKLTPDIAQSIISSQLPQDIKAQKSTHVLDNNSTQTTQLYQQIDQLLTS